MSRPQSLELDGSFDWNLLPDDKKDELRKALIERQKRISRRLLFSLFPDDDTVWEGDTNKDFRHGQLIYARHKYPKHLEFFRAGATYRERCAMCANRVSKTLGMGAFEMTLHLTGHYPHWWEGRMFDGPIQGWAAGKTNETTRDIVQRTLLGEVRSGTSPKVVTGTGTIPGDMIGALTWKAGVTDLVDTVRVKHKSGGWSVLGLKSFQQGRGSFEGTAQSVIWLDEEPPIDVYGECLIRTATTNGIVYLTFTPLEGISEVVKSFQPGSDVAA